MKPVRYDPRTSAQPALEPFGLMRSLLRWDPFRDLDASLDSGGGFSPCFDVRETPAAYVFEADLPGIRQEDLDINLTGNRLTLSGRREFQERLEDGCPFISERSFGAFTRSFTLPDGVDAGAIQAALDHGVLTLTLPKVPEVQPKKIHITPGAGPQAPEHPVPEPGEDRPAPSLEARG